MYLLQATDDGININGGTVVFVLIVVVLLLLAIFLIQRIR